MNKKVEKTGWEKELQEKLLAYSVAFGVREDRRKLFVEQLEYVVKQELSRRDEQPVKGLEESKQKCEYDEEYNCKNEPYDCDANTNFNRGIIQAIELIQKQEGGK